MTENKQFTPMHRPKISIGSAQVTTLNFPKIEDEMETIDMGSAQVSTLNFPKIEDKRDNHGK